MPVSSVVTRGLGNFGCIPCIVTSGFDCTCEPAPAPGIITVQEAIVALLRSGQPSTLQWSINESPYYDEMPEPPIELPYLVFTIPPSRLEYNFEVGYVEVYDPDFILFGIQSDIAAISSPYFEGSVINFLDSFMNNPGFLDGDNFECISFLRQSWHMGLEKTRAPDGQRVWSVSAKYEMRVRLGRQPYRIK